MPGAILRTSCIQLHLILPAILHLIKRSRYYYPYFIVEETEAQKDIQLNWGSGDAGSLASESILLPII